MSWRALVLLSACWCCCLLPLLGQQQAEGPTSEKAQKTFKEASALEQKHDTQWALEGFKKADKQDDGHCLACQKKMIKYGIELQDWKVAETAAGEIMAAAHDPKDEAQAHYQLGSVLLAEARDKRKDDIFNRAHEEMAKALQAYANFPDAIYDDGLALAQLKQDDDAKARFEQYARMRPESDPNRQRALRYVSQPELARARMAPPFAISTTDGQRITLDDLAGKVVLLDFWATWCAPCREALPHMREIAKKFQGQPLVVLSVSLDDDEQKWKDFVTKNEMTWLQYRDGGFAGPISKMFGVRAIPHTFTIDSDGVLQDERIGDASIEGKLKKLVARVHEAAIAPKPGQ